MKKKTIILAIAIIAIFALTGCSEKQTAQTTTNEEPATEESSTDVETLKAEIDTLNKQLEICYVMYDDLQFKSTAQTSITEIILRLDSIILSSGGSIENYVRDTEIVFNNAKTELNDFRANLTFDRNSASTLFSKSYNMFSSKVMMKISKFRLENKNVDTKTFMSNILILVNELVDESTEYGKIYKNFLDDENADPEAFVKELDTLNAKE